MSRSSICAIVLAAGLSSRMVGTNKLLTNLRGEPLLAQTLGQVTNANFTDVIVVTGHRHAEIEKLAARFSVTLVHNPNYEEGLSTSIKAGIAALPMETAAVAIILGDMPYVTTQTYNKLIASTRDHDDIIVPTYKNRQGNPLIWGREYFAYLAALTGDKGARQLLEEFSEHIRAVALSDPGVHIDFDTPESFFEQNGGN